jgi:hypothetical protein
MRIFFTLGPVLESLSKNLLQVGCPYLELESMAKPLLQALAREAFFNSPDLVLESLVKPLLQVGFLYPALESLAKPLLQALGC